MKQDYTNNFIAYPERNETKHYILIIAFIVLGMLMYTGTHAQSTRMRVVEGVLLDETGYPSIGVSIIIKGTTQGVVTDTDGKYRIEAQIGDVLVFSFVGYQSEEVEVTTANSKPLNGINPPPAIRINRSGNKKMVRSPVPTKQGANTAILDNQSPVVKLSDYSYEQRHRNDKNWTEYNRPRYLPKAISSFKSNGRGIIEIKEKTGGYSDSKPSVSLRSTFLINKAFSLPELQSTFAQGRPVNGQNVWRGPETGELFSWGPAVSQLEYIGAEYPWDNNGQLVGSGEGNGVPANVYNNQDLLKGFGKSFNNYLSASIPFKFGIKYSLSVQNNTENGFIPTTKKQQNTLANSLRMNVRGLKLEGKLRYTEGKDKLPSLGNNYARILSSIYRTPVSFDNRNGLTSKEAISNSSSYLLPDGNQRNFATDQVDNPYWMLNTLPDEGRKNGLLAGFEASYDFGAFNINGFISHNKTNEFTKSGMIPLSAGHLDGMLLERNQIASLTYSHLEVEYNRTWGKVNFESKLKYAYNQDNAYLNRQTNENLANTDATDNIRYEDSRLTHEPGVDVKVEVYRTYQLPNFVATAILNSYSSTTSDKRYFLPVLGMKVGLHPLFDDYIYFIDRMAIRSEWSRSIQEAPLIYKSVAFNTLKYHSSEYLNYFEKEELFNHSNLLSPEIHTKFEYGGDLSVLDGRLNLAYTHYLNQVDNVMLPTQSNGEYTLSNIGRSEINGDEVSLMFNSYFYWDLCLSVGITYHSYTQKMKDVYSNTIIPVTGFADVYGVAAEGEALGVLYGSAYVRNDQNQLVMGSDGFPLVNAEKIRLGDPTPDWKGGLDIDAEYRGFGLSLLFETSQGGKAWDGTRNYLNYWGYQSKLSWRETQVAMCLMVYWKMVRRTILKLILLTLRILYQKTGG